MTAVPITLLFFAAALLIAGTLTHGWQTFRRRHADLTARLTEVERGVSVRFVRREVGAVAATVYRLRFSPPAASLPYHPEHERRAAA